MVSKILCLVLCFSSVLCQFGFFPQRDNRRISPASPFGFIQNVIPDPNRIRNTLMGIFQPGGVINGPYNYENNYQANRPNTVRFPGGVPYDNVNFEPQTTSNEVNQEQGFVPGSVEQNPGFVSGSVDENPGFISGSVDQNPGFVTGSVDQNSGFVSGSAGENPGFISGSVDQESAFNSRPAEPTQDVTEGYGKDSGLISGSVAADNGLNSGNKFGEGDGLISGTVATPSQGENAFGNRNGEFSGQGVFEEPCQTVEGGSGSCIPLTSCEPYLRLISHARTDAKSRMMLQRSQCGFEGNLPKVCCPKLGIPSQPPTDTTTTTSTTTTSTTTAAVGKTAGDSDYVTAFPEPPVCGVSSGSFGKVVGGVDAKLGDFPWIALLGYQNNRDQSTRWRCGGSLITDRHVLTAAHCIHNHEDELYVVRLGELDLISDNDGASPIDVLIKSKLKHDQYNAASFENDIGMLYLQNTVEFSTLISPICLPTTPGLRQQSFERRMPMIAGWGDVQFRGPSATHLQVVQLPVQSNDLCMKAYAKYPKQVIDSRVLCAGYKEGGKDACQGDSGGPLMLPDWNNVTYKVYIYQIGVVSYGKNCAEAGFPGVYSRITHFLPWLEKVVLGVQN